MAFSHFQPEPKVMSSVPTSTGRVFIGPNDGSGIKGELLLRIDLQCAQETVENQEGRCPGSSSAASKIHPLQGPDALPRFLLRI